MPNSSKAARWKASPTVVARQIRGEVLLVPISRSSASLNELFALNPTAAFVWTEACAGNSEQEIASALVANFQLDTIKASSDVRKTLADLVEIGALEARPLES